MSAKQNRVRPLEVTKPEAPSLPKPSKPTLRDSIPLGERDALTYREAAMLGYGSERTLRQMIRIGWLKRCVLPNGKRGVRLHRTTLLEELQELQAKR